ncbi:M20 family metallo-hydrolase [Pontibacter sp. BT310]|uniref:M20 family metallo-hydrolase n=1 Tax=Pontibacter populi TaxID=890055 RepID=A0ABS6X9T2_9BACT|nr:MULTISPECIES: M20 family metallo-hydrolase [Pontibacter]MBJ6117873.1 M20 family metallo-hydrolase [Pontibacter sp. BT310]MBR0570300.1 M20 family metallo-hydrolase [Microvirga sp. STS03]MBW3364726.1 M20 family metallo-hydrolase [Pontibacter populi]
MTTDQLYTEALDLLQQLISIPSFSREEDKTADAIYSFLERHGVKAKRQGNNVWAFNQNYNPELPTILLNSHHDTVKPNAGYTFDPFTPTIKDGKLFGLGSSDAGGCLVSLIASFLYFYPMQNLNYNFVLAATAEEEISGINGLEAILPELGEIDFAIVGEPTQMHLAVAEKGLLVLDCVVHGKAGHAAREEGVNAIYEALPDIEWFRNYKFEKVSDTLGPIKMSVTVVQAGSQHNVVPDTCKFTVDVRVTDAYSLEEVLATIREHVKATVTPRSVRLQPSGIPLTHPIVQAGIQLGRNTYGSPTTSDQALLRVPSVKLGPGDSARSHTADEYIELQELEEGIELYIKMLSLIMN